MLSRSRTAAVIVLSSASVLAYRADLSATACKVRVQGCSDSAAACSDPSAYLANVYCQLECGTNWTGFIEEEYCQWNPFQCGVTETFFSYFLLCNS